MINGKGRFILYFAANCLLKNDWKTCEQALTVPEFAEIATSLLYKGNYARLRGVYYTERAISGVLYDLGIQSPHTQDYLPVNAGLIQLSIDELQTAAEHFGMEKFKTL